MHFPIVIGFVTLLVFGLMRLKACWTHVAFDMIGDSLKTRCSALQRVAVQASDR